MKCDVGISEDLYANVVLLHHFHGTGERMSKALTAWAPSTTAKVVAPVRAKVFGEEWRTYPVFPQYLPAMWASKGTYDESGLPRAHDADHVRDVQRSRHVRGDPVRRSCSPRGVLLLWSGTALWLWLTRPVTTLAPVVAQPVTTCPIASATPFAHDALCAVHVRGSLHPLSGVDLFFVFPKGD